MSRAGRWPTTPLAPLDVQPIIDTCRTTIYDIIARDDFNPDHASDITAAINTAIAAVLQRVDERDSTAELWSWYWEDKHHALAANYDRVSAELVAERTAHGRTTFIRDYAIDQLRELREQRDDLRAEATAAWACVDTLRVERPTDC